MCFIIGLLFPVFSLVYLLAPRSTLGLFIKKPFIKFICHTASYLTFLFLLLLASQHIARTNLHIQGPPPTVVEWMILPWVLGEYDWMCHGDVGHIACIHFVNEIYYEIVCKSTLYWYSSNIQVRDFYLTLNPSNKVLQLIKPFKTYTVFNFILWIIWTFGVIFILVFSGIFLSHWFTLNTFKI